MEFAERMLRKYGWDAGKYFYRKFYLIENFFSIDKGLGKDNQGMKTALKPVLKFDSRGVNCFFRIRIIFVLKIFRLAVIKKMNIQVNLNGGNILIIELQKKFLNHQKIKIKNVNIKTIPKKNKIPRKTFIPVLKRLVSVSRKKLKFIFF